MIARWSSTVFTVCSVQFPTSPRLRALWTHVEVGHATCGVVLSGWSLTASSKLQGAHLLCCLLSQVPRDSIQLIAWLCVCPPTYRFQFYKIVSPRTRIPSFTPKYQNYVLGNTFIVHIKQHQLTYWRQEITLHIRQNILTSHINRASAGLGGFFNK